METEFLLLVLLAISSGRGLDSTACDLCLDGVCYGSNALLDSPKIGRNDAVAIDRMKHILYFVDKDDDTLKFLNLTDKSIEATPIFVLQIFQSITVDQKTHDMFIADFWNQNMYKYNPASNESLRFHMTNNPVIKLWFTDKLYGLMGFIDRNIYTIDGGQVKKYTTLNNVERMFSYFKPEIIDKRGDIYFNGCVTTLINSFSCSVYKLTAGTETPVKILNDTNVILSTDRQDKAYFIYQKGRNINIQRLDYDTNQHVEVGLLELPPHVELISSVLFDKDNNLVFEYRIVTGGVYELHHLKANSKRCKITKVFYKHSRTQKSVIEEL